MTTSDPALHHGPRPGVTLALLLASAGLILGSGIWLARREVERRIPADRALLRETAATLQAELSTMDALYLGHLLARSFTMQRNSLLQIDSLPLDRKNAYIAEQEDIMNRRYPSDPRATVQDFANHIDYAVKLIGIDHIGIASDFDGGGGVDGWNNASETINVTRELVKRGYTEAQIAKIWSGNLLRVLDEVQAVSKKIQAGALK